jgi:hypothetical protein
VEQAEDLASLAPAPVFVDDTGRRRRLTRRVGRVLLVGFAAYIGLVMMGFARDPRLGPLHLPTIGLPDLGLVIPPAPLVLGEQTTGSPAAAEIEVSTAGASAGDVQSGPSSGVRPAAINSRGTGVSGPRTSPSGLAPAPRSPATMPPAGSGATTTSTSATTTTAGRGNSPKATTTSTAPTASLTPSTTTPTTPGQGPVSAKGPDGSGPPGQQRKTTSTTGG